MGHIAGGSKSAAGPHELSEVVRIAREAGEILVSYFETNLVHTRAKGPRDVVTAADFAAEKHVLDQLRTAFPDDGVVAEEGSRVGSGSGRTWYVDPLDGTLNYSRGLPIWCVSIALFEGGRPILGVIHDPLRSETFRAAHGQGVWCNESALATSGPERLSDAFVHVTIDFNDDSMLEGIDDVRIIAPRVLRTRNIGSAALALAYVAAGRFDAMLHRHAHTWDYAAGVALIQEAGGAVTDMRGEPFSQMSTSLVAASNAGIQAELLALVLSRAPA